jgi:hypothetical protein
MEASVGDWSKRLVQKLGTENVRQTIGHLHELKHVLDADTEHFDAGQEQRSGTVPGPGS